MEIPVVEAAVMEYPDDWVKPFACNHVVVSFTPEKQSEERSKKKKKSRKQTSICVMCGEKVKDKHNKAVEKDETSNHPGNQSETGSEPGSRETWHQMFSSTRSRTGSQVSLRPNIETCSMHSHKKIKYYCEDHQELCCSVCVNVLHPKCERVMLIKDEIKTGFDEELCRNTIDALKNIRKSFEQIHHYNDKILETLELKCKEAMSKRDVIRERIMKLLEDFENTTNKSMKKYMKEAKQEINSTIAICNEAVKDVDSSLEALEQTLVSKVTKDMFIATQKSNSQKENYAIALSKAINHTKEINIEIVSESNLANIEEIECIGKIEFSKHSVSFPELLISSVSKIPAMEIRTPRTVRDVFTRSESVSSLSPRQPCLQGTFNTRLTDDKLPCENVAAAFLPDGKIAIADMKNCKLKIFDKKFRQGLSVTLTSGPRGIAVISPQEVAVSLPDESKIQLVTVSKKLKCTRSILTNIPCYGITCHEQDLVLLCDDGFSFTAIQTIDLNGQVKKTLEISKSSKVVLKNPWNIAVSCDGKQICITDRGRLLCVSMDGSLLFKYYGDDLDNARGLAIDHRGRFYVCGTGSNNLHQVSPDGEKIKILLGDQDIVSPQAVCVDSERGLMLLTNVGSETVALYKMANT